MSEAWRAFFFGAGGVAALGWLLTQTSSWWAVRGQRQHVYRRMLYYLLQLEWIHERMDVSEWVEHYINRIRELAAPEKMPEEVEQILRDQITPALAAQAIKRTREELEALEDGYTKAIDELSHISPFLAFRLEGRTSIVERLESAQEYADDMLTPELGVNAEQRDVLKQAIADMRPDLLEEDLEQIQELLRAISWRIGIFTYWRCLRGYRNHGELSKDEKEGMNELIDNFLERAKANAQATGLA